MLSLLLIGSVPAGFAGGYGFDILSSPADHAAHLAASDLSGAQGEWMRVRGVVDPAAEKPGDLRTVATDRAGLKALRARGIRTALHLRWGPAEWSQGVRAGGGHRLPLDLREVYERGRRLGAAYGDVVDVWEIENEPDIDFVAENPETYAAFQKAVYLGIHAGVGAANFRGSELARDGSEIASKLAPTSTWRALKRGWSSLNLKFPPSTSRTTRVIMAPLALPPGPYFERLWANGLASYTDGFNFHYYGYAEDFTGVYRQFEDAITSNPQRAVSGLKSRSLEARKLETNRLEARSLPVFITEYGFGLLDILARDTVEGRVRQWRWFATLAEQIRTLRPEGPMAFLLNPYYEANLNEFGLTTPHALKLAGRSPLRSDGSSNAASAGVRAPEAGGAESDTQIIAHKGAPTFQSSDFGEARVQPWMRRIGHKIGENYATPALAYLLDYAQRHPYRPRAWQVEAEVPSPVVIDFVAGTDLTQMKSAGGYLAQGKVDAASSPRSSTNETRPDAASALLIRSGRGRVILYNFSDAPVSGSLVISGDGVKAVIADPRVTLAAGERRELPVELAVQARRFVGNECRMTFIPDGGALSRGVFVTRFFPATDGMTGKRVAGFNHDEERSRGRQTALLARPLAAGEPRVQAQGRWVVTDGVRVEEIGGFWRFYIDQLPAEPLRPAWVELPLPEGFTIEPETLIVLDRRRVPVAPGTGVPATADPARLQPRAGVAGDAMDVYFRMENGNLFQTWPRLRVTESWSPYVENAENFTMAFFGRAALPWRFAENRPVSLVFFLRPSQVPAIFEVRDARIVKVATP